jgi:hypothetical protein
VTNDARLTFPHRDRRSVRSVVVPRLRKVEHLTTDRARPIVHDHVATLIGSVLPIENRSDERLLFDLRLIRNDATLRLDVVDARRPGAPLAVVSGAASRARDGDRDRLHRILVSLVVCCSFVLGQSYRDCVIIRDLQEKILVTNV